jgi:hypothetical protein
MKPVPKRCSQCALRYYLRVVLSLTFPTSRDAFRFLEFFLKRRLTNDYSPCWSRAE